MHQAPWWGRLKNFTTQESKENAGKAKGQRKKSHQTISNMGNM
jgi:hypothetical protein